MFKFDEYPEIKKVHNEYSKLNKRSYKLDSAYHRSFSENDRKMWRDSINDCLTYYEVYAKPVYKLFSMLKPKLLNIRTKKYEKWDRIFVESSFEKFTTTEFRILFGLIERQGLYRLPPEYYENGDQNA